MKVLKGKLTERGLKGLDYAIDEMIEFNKIVLNQVLLPMKTYENMNVRKPLNFHDVCLLSSTAIKG